MAGRRLRRPSASFGRVLVALVLAALAASATLVAPPVARAQTLDSTFLVNEGAAFTRRARVTMGDHGWSPFFHPGVIVWDGGSILSGAGQPQAFGPPAQTLELLPHTVRSYLSITNGSHVADMLVEAPLEIDARVDTEADANVCVAMPGGNDLAQGMTAEELYTAVRQYCDGRRAAGMKVVLVDLLPRISPAEFEAERTRYNDLVRAAWPEFADGLADIGGDPRIGDDLDYFDLHYYSVDGTHLSAAGYSVMADIIAPVVAAQTWRSDTCELRFRNAGYDWTAWHDYAALSAWELERIDGVKTVEAEYRLGGETATRADSIALDRQGPKTYAIEPAVVRRFKPAYLYYRVLDPVPGSARATVAIVIKAADGTIVKRLELGTRPVDVALRARFLCRLAKGQYTFFVHARDEAGNAQVKIGHRTLTVKGPARQSG